MLGIKQIMPWSTVIPGEAKTNKIKNHDIRMLEGRDPMFRGIQRDVWARLLIEPNLDVKQLNQFNHLNPFICGADEIPFTSVDSAFSQKVRVRGFDPDVEKPSQSQPCVSHSSQNNPGNHTGVGTCQREIAKLGNNVSLVKDTMILLEMDHVVDGNAIRFFASCPDLMRFSRKHQISHTNLEEFKLQIAHAINRFFHDRDRIQATCVTMRNILCFMGHQIVSTGFARDFVWIMAMVTHKDLRNQKIFANDAILGVLLHFFDVARTKQGYCTRMLAKNIVQVLLNISSTSEGKRICNTPEVAVILDFAARNNYDNIVHANILQIKQNLPLCLIYSGF